MFKSHCNAFSVKMKGYDKGDRSQGFTLPCNRFVFNFHCTAFSILKQRDVDVVAMYGRVSRSRFKCAILDRI